ncbi:MAG: SDR family NAD(P)-dependent oxidoreductase [Actinobacteria bacterium]|nr:SDR family NAD(P)-dependent oxidoreductase [Actinomycetota bacterium]
MAAGTGATTGTDPTAHFDWTGTRVVVTGTSSGIGAALAHELAKAGAVVAMCARRTELLDAVLADARRHSPDSVAFTVDLADLEAVDRFAADATAALGGVDVLIHNAALSNYHAGALDTPWDDVEYLVRVNYLSPVRLTRALLPAMLAQGSGHVVAVSSMAKQMSSPGESAYAATKAALSAWFEALATEEWTGGVRFHLVYPALIGLEPGVDADDSVADTSDSSEVIPAPVLARAMLRQVERDESSCSCRTPRPTSSGTGRPTWCR